MAKSIWAIVLCSTVAVEIEVALRGLIWNLFKMFKRKASVVNPIHTEKIVGL